MPEEKKWQKQKQCSKTQNSNKDKGKIWIYIFIEMLITDLKKKTLLKAFSWMLVTFFYINEWIITF